MDQLEMETISMTSKKVRTHLTLTLAAADLVIRRAREHADAIGKPMVIALSDAAGNLLNFCRMDNAPLLSVDLAINKAWTAVSFGIPTHEWHEFIKNDPPLAAGAPSIPRLVIFGGGYPLIVDDQIVGAIGVSGGHYLEDQAVAEAGIEGFQEFDVLHDEAIASASEAAALSGVADQFFSAVEKGDIGRVRELYSPEVSVWHNFDDYASSRDESLAVLGWVSKHVEGFRFEQVRRSFLPGAFLQQHVIRGRDADGADIHCPAILKVEVAGGRITRIEEYFDASQMPELGADENGEPQHSSCGPNSRNHQSEVSRR